MKKQINRTTYPFPENLLRDLIDRQAVGYIEKIDLKKAIDNFSGKITKVFFKDSKQKNISIYLSFYEYPDKDYEELGKDYGLTSQQTRNIIWNTLYFLSSKADWFFVDSDLYEEVKSLESEYKGLVEYYKKSIKIIKRKEEIKDGKPYQNDCLR